MSNPSFVFLHVGSDTQLPRLLTASICRLHPDAQIIQCSDAVTPAVPGVTRVHHVDGDTARLMTFRLAAFASLALTETAIYLDTDMLCVRTVDPVAALAGHDVALCRRDFDRDALFNTAFRGLNLAQYQGQTLDEVYPYLACATITRDAQFWNECLHELEGLDEQFHRWYGDQEAIRAVAQRGSWRLGHLPESIFAHLPDKAAPAATQACILHFKGPSRKALMLTLAQQLHLAA